MAGSPGIWRWKGISKQDRRRAMAKVTQVRVEKAKARKLIEAIELVKAAGYQIQIQRPPGNGVGAGV